MDARCGNVLRYAYLNPEQKDSKRSPYRFDFGLLADVRIRSEL